jgi:VanZ family protein
MNKISFIKFIPGIAWFFIVLYLTCLPGDKLPQINWMNSIPDFDKLVHIGLFGGLTFLFCWPFYKSHFNNKKRLQYFIKIAIAASLWGLTIEFIQKFYIPGRSYDLLDWAADSVGALVSFLFCRKYFIKKLGNF